ncbi:MAG: hypothetical protein EBY39_03145 [Flavobacteriia bacterium]|nr:hypothetical protein [Flavobacteriia bacterium]
MSSTLTGKKISQTYEGLIKTDTNQPTDATGKTKLTDGVGNEIGISIQRNDQLVHIDNLEVQGVSLFEDETVVNGQLFVNGLTPVEGTEPVIVNFKRGEFEDIVLSNTYGNTQTLTIINDGSGSVSINKFVDEADGIANNDNDTSIPTTAAIKDYVDTNVTAQDLDFTGDNGTSGQVDLDSQTFNVVGKANQIVTEASNQQIKIELTDDVTIENDLTVENDVTIENDLEVSNTITTEYAIVDSHLHVNSNADVFGTLDMHTNKITDVADPTNTKDAANKGYVDSQITAQDLDFSGNNGTGDVDLDSEAFEITGSNGIVTTALNNTLDIDGSTLQTAINTNATDISTNASNISTNAQNIATNEAETIINAGNIATNQNNIATNTANITTNTANIASNDTDIANLQTDVATNTSNIATNTSDIATNTSNISTNASNISTNASNIATNTSNITTNANDIADLQTDLGDKVNKAGDTMSGALNMGSNFITNVADPANNKDAANKEYVDQSIDSIVHYQTLTGMVNNLASQGSGGYDFMEWTSNVTGTAQIPAIRLPQGLKLVKVSWVWLGEVALSIGAGEQVEFSLRTLTPGTRSSISNYTNEGTLFTIDQNDNGTFAYGTETLSTPITLSAGDIIACIGQETGTVEPNNGELAITFLFEIV